MLEFKINWILFHRIYKNLKPLEKSICEAIGVTEDSLIMYSMFEDGSR